MGRCGFQQQMDQPCFSPYASSSWYFSLTDKILLHETLKVSLLDKLVCYASKFGWNFMTFMSRRPLGFALLGRRREDAEERNDEIDAQVRLEVGMRLAATDRRHALCR